MAGRVITPTATLFALRLVLVLAAILGASGGLTATAVAAAAAVGAASPLAEAPLMVIGLVADNHYDAFPAGEKAPWQPMDKWLEEQQRRTTTITKRRYDIARDKMIEAVDAFNRVATGNDARYNEHFSPLRPPTLRRPTTADLAARDRWRTEATNMTAVVNLGDLVNNGIMWNLRPILDAFNGAFAPRFSILGNHDLRSHNDRFGKSNATQDAWMRSKLGLRDWFYAVEHPPFLLVFLDTMVMEDPPTTPKRREQLAWLEATLQHAAANKLAVILFGHISIGLQTSPFAPLLKSYPHIVGGFYGHHHKGGYVLQDGYLHTTIIQGQIETLSNAYAVLEVFRDRMELTGFGRVPSRVMRFLHAPTVELLQAYKGPTRHSLRTAMHQGPRDPWTGDAQGATNASTATAAPAGDGGRARAGKERLQAMPPLNLMLPSYRKPLAPLADPNPGDTRFLRVDYPQWPRRIKRLVVEAPVDLVSYETRARPQLYRAGIDDVAAPDREMVAAGLHDEGAAPEPPAGASTRSPMVAPHPPPPTQAPHLAVARRPEPHGASTSVVDPRLGTPASGVDEDTGLEWMPLAPAVGAVSAAAALVVALVAVRRRRLLGRAASPTVTPSLAR
jgi:hypothetical protein